MMTMHSPRREPDGSSEQGAALVSAVLILLVLTAIATGGYWVSRGEMSASQGYSQSIRALYVAESGLARYFAMNPVAKVDTIFIETFVDPCADVHEYPSPADQAQCYLDDEDWEEEYIEHFSLSAPPPQVFTMVGANVYVTSDFIIGDGQSLIYEIRAEARVENAPDPGGFTVRIVDTWARLAPPFNITSVFAATGGVDFAGVDQHHHFDSEAKVSKEGTCGAETTLPNLQIPTGQFSLPLPHVDCPYGDACPYKYHMKGNGLEVDSFTVLGSDITAAIGIDWTQYLNDGFYTGVDSVVLLDDSEDFEAYFDKSKDKDFKNAEIWPITRYTGDISTDVRVKGYGILIVDGDVLVTDDKIEWTGLMLVGGTISTINTGHIHIKGAAVAGLGCTDAEIAAGLCRSQLFGEHNDFKYRPCEINKSWSRLMSLVPIQDLWREASPNW